MFDKFQNFYIKEEDIMCIKADLNLNFIIVAVRYSNYPKIFKYKNNEDLLNDMKYFKDEEEWTMFDRLNDCIYINSEYLHLFILDKNNDGIETISFCFRFNNTVYYLDEIEVDKDIRKFIEDTI